MEPLNDRDADETIMEDHAHGDAGETSAIKQLHHTKHVVITHVVIGVVRVWASERRRQEEQHANPVASMDYGFFTERHKP